VKVGGGGGICVIVCVSVCMCVCVCLYMCACVCACMMSWDKRDITFAFDSQNKDENMTND